jgi:hypothetical protein
MGGWAEWVGVWDGDKNSYYLIQYIFIYEVKVKKCRSKMTEERKTSVNVFGFLCFVI